MSSTLNIPSQFLDILPDLFFVVSADRMILDCNKKAREMFGISSLDYGSVSFYSLLTDDSPRPLLAVLRTDRNSTEGEVRFRTRDGRIIEAEVHIVRVEENDGVLLYVFARDISEVKRRELDLLRFSSVVHYTVNPIQITDKQGRMVYVNPAFERATGFSKEDLIGRNPNIISSGKQTKEFWQRVWAVIGAGDVWHGEIENRRKNGQPLHTQLLISPIIDSEQQVVGFLGAHRDITKQKELEQQLMHSQKMESIGTLAAGIAHEVGNPLASISSIVQVLQRTTNEEFAKDKLRLVQSQVQRITKIIRDLVDFSRPSNYTMQPTDVVRAVRESIEIVKISKKAKGVTFALDVLGDVPSLSLVPDQIAQVFLNILLNAVDAMDGKAGEVRIIIERGGTRVTISIADTGSGIVDDNLSKIFEPFFTTKRVGEGTGLGLWVSYGIVQSFGGDIQVSSEVGKGTTFSIILPLNAKDQVHG